VGQFEYSGRDCLGNRDFSAARFHARIDAGPVRPLPTITLPRKLPVVTQSAFDL
jgi:hypothetical protein